jgi:dienelactone hydrolase
MVAGSTQRKTEMNQSVSYEYFDSRRYFHKLFNERSRQMGLKASEPAAVRAWQRKARAKLIDLLGLKRMLPAARPRARRVEATDAGDHTRELWLIQTQREVTLPFYLLRPKGTTGPLPAVICPHGHSSGGKLSPAGVRANEAVAQSIEQHNYDYGVQFARAGLLAFCPDARGFGQRQEREVRADPMASSCHHLQMMGGPLGIPVAGMWTFDLMRLADHVLARRDVLPDRLACAGLSGGGLQTLYFSAVDQRLRCAVISGYFYGARDALLEQPGNCPCNMVPHLWESFDMGDVGALIAPRALLIETGDVDGLNGLTGVKNVKSQVRITRQAYRAHGAAERLVHDIFPGPHTWHGVQAIPWVKRWLAE